MAHDLDDDELRATRKLNGVDICIGDYVRTDKGYIVKADEKWFKDKLIEGNSAFGKALKHSPNLIDLIEVGDYVNGKKVERINDYGDFKRADFNLDYDDCDAVYNSDIKTIVTHQQFNSVMYKLGE